MSARAALLAHFHRTSFDVETLGQSHEPRDIRTYRMRARAVRYSAMVRATRSSTESTSVTPDVECPALQISRHRAGRFSRADVDIVGDVARAAMRQVVGVEAGGGYGGPQHSGLQAGKSGRQQDIVGTALTSISLYLASAMLSRVPMSRWSPEGKLLDQARADGRIAVSAEQLIEPVAHPLPRHSARPQAKMIALLRSSFHAGACALSLLDDEALDSAAEITAGVRKPRRGEARAIGTNPGFGIEQNPLPDRLPRKTDGEVGIDERPFPEVQHG